MAIDKDVDKLVQMFEEKYKEYNNWTFDYEYPGYFVYRHGDGDLSVYFTPEWNEKGKVSIQINKDDEMVYAEEIPYSSPIDATKVFQIVRPYLDLLGTLT